MTNLAKNFNSIASRFSNFLFMHPLATSLAAIGTYAVAKTVCSGCNMVAKYCLPRNVNLKQTFGGEYALVIGPLDPINKEYIRQLETCYKIMLISDTGSNNKDETIAKTALILNVDVLHYKDEDNERIVNFIKGKDIGICILNQSICRASDYKSMEASKIKDLINANVDYISQLASILCNSIKSRKLCTGLVHVSCIMKEGSFPYFALYSASLSYQCTLIKALALEPTKMKFLRVYVNSSNDLSISKQVSNHLRVVGKYKTSYGTIGKYVDSKISLLKCNKKNRELTGYYALRYFQDKNEVMG